MLSCVDKSVNCHLLQHLWSVEIILNSCIDLLNRPRGLEWDDKFGKSRFVFGGNIGGHHAPREESLGVLEKLDQSKLVNAVWRPTLRIIFLSKLASKTQILDSLIPLAKSSLNFKWVA